MIDGDGATTSIAAEGSRSHCKRVHLAKAEVIWKDVVGLFEGICEWKEGRRMHMVGTHGTIMLQPFFFKFGH